EVLDRGDLGENLVETTDRLIVAGVYPTLEPRGVANEPLEGLDLQIEQIRNLKRLVDLRE
ncbi:MAG: hypothetical protein JWR88_1932, partial [Pseudonocardia sp.]|nr:hypothetical protein [Pseudonocardia sp.]